MKNRFAVVVAVIVLLRAQRRHSHIIRLPLN